MGNQSRRQFTREISTGPWLNTFEFRTSTHPHASTLYALIVHGLSPAKTYTFTYIIYIYIYIPTFTHKKDPPGQFAIYLDLHSLQTEPLFACRASEETWCDDQRELDQRHSPFSRPPRG